MSILAIIVIAVIVAGLATAVVVPAVVSEPTPPTVHPEIPAAVAPFDPAPKDEQPVRSERDSDDLSGLPGWEEGPLDTYEDPSDADEPASDPEWQPEPEEESARTGGMSGALGF